MPRPWRLALFKRGKPLTDGGLNHLGRPVLQRVKRRDARLGDAPFDFEPLFCQKPAGHGGDQRRVKRGKQGKLDM